MLAVRLIEHRQEDSVVEEEVPVTMLLHQITLAQVSSRPLEVMGVLTTK